MTPFWQSKKLHQMTPAEWESLCDGCGKCCLNKLIDDDTEALHFTDVCCDLLDTASGRCSNYSERRKFVPDCVSITAENLSRLYYLPHSCAYRRLAEGRDLAAWHPLRHQGDRRAMIAAGMSVVGRVQRESQLSIDLEDRIVTWPLRDCD
jgi:uncharacterized cysteine cluster protein YcgN (CxxCxxCC family)